MLKIFLSSIIIALGISGAVFALNNPLNQGDLVIKETAIAESNNAVDLNQPFKKPLSQLSAVIDNKNGAENSPGTAQLNNYTELFAENIKNQLVAVNPNGPQVVDGKSQLNVPDVDTIATDLLAEAGAKFNLQNYIPEIKDADIKIIDNSPENLLNYGKLFDQIIDKNRISDLATAEELDAETLNKIIKNYENAITDFYTSQAPKLMAGVHKTEIRYLTAQLNLLNLIKNSETDPILAMLAGQSLESLESEFQKQIAKELGSIISTN